MNVIVVAMMDRHVRIANAKRYMEQQELMKNYIVIAR